MKKTSWRKHHKWLGIAFGFFILMFCLSGIVLNHRTIVSDINVERKWLPERYRYKAWNGGLLRGTTPYSSKDSATGVLVYGTGGIWQTDREASFFADFNKGLPDGADYRQVRNMVQTVDMELFAVSILGLYRYGGKDVGWQPVSLPKEDNEMLTDAVCHGDTLIVAGRSHLYLSEAPYTSFKSIQLRQPEDYRGKVSLFRMVWMLHSGELFGTTGRGIADAIAVALIALCITGLAYWPLHKYLHRIQLKGGNTHKTLWITRILLLWHDKIGRSTIAFTIFIAVTGWCLRPPAMVLLALTKVSAIPGTVLDSSNPWNDKLRMIRYDDTCKDWLLSTSEGFYSLKKLEDTPVRINHAPPVSVMGLNVLQKDNSGKWLCGSFSGMFVWDRQQHTVADYFTNEPAKDMPGTPFGKQAISGYSQDLTDSEFAVEYYKGTNAITQPTEFETLPMSLWNVALEVHSGRIFIGVVATYTYVLFAGTGAAWCLWSGWKLRKKKNRRHLHGIGR